MRQTQGNKSIRVYRGFFCSYVVNAVAVSSICSTTTTDATTILSVYTFPAVNSNWICYCRHFLHWAMISFCERPEEIRLSVLLSGLWGRLVGICQVGRFHVFHVLLSVVSIGHTFACSWLTIPTSGKMQTRWRSSECGCLGRLCLFSVSCVSNWRQMHWVYEN